MVRAAATRARLSRRPLVLVLGVLAELVVLVPFSLYGQEGRFIGSVGALPVAIACLAALLAGPVTGAAVASSGWAFFFPGVIDWSPFGLVALPLWAGPATLVGFLKMRLNSRERELAVFEAERRYEELRRDLTNQAHHEVRTPATVIYGMAEVLLREDLDLTDEQTRKFLGLIAESAKRLGDVPERLEHHEAVTPLRPVRLSPIDDSRRQPGSTRSASAS